MSFMTITYTEPECLSNGSVYRNLLRDARPRGIPTLDPFAPLVQIPCLDIDPRSVSSLCLLLPRPECHHGKCAGCANNRR